MMWRMCSISTLFVVVLAVYLLMINMIAKHVKRAAISICFRKRRLILCTCKSPFV